MSSPDPKAHSQLDDTSSRLKITMGELEATKVGVFSQRAIKKLRRGNSSGEALTSDHLIFAPVSFSKILPPIVSHCSNMETCSLVLAMAVVQPIPKIGNKHYSLSTNYQSITLYVIARLLNYVFFEFYALHLL